MPPSPGAYFRGEVSRLRTIHRRNLSTLHRQPWSEISGAFGDIGTFIPIFIALSQPRFRGNVPAISPASTLVVSGVANVLTGIFFGIPLPVQPMKAIAAVVIASPTLFSQSSVASAGIFTGAVVGVLSVTGLVQWFTRAMPIPIVKGIQVSAGLNLMMSGLRKLGPLWRGVDFDDTARGVEAGVFAAAAILLLVSALRPRLHFVGIVMAVAFVVAVMYTFIAWNAANDWFTGLGIWHPHFLLPSWSSFQHGAFDAGLGQVPLTTLNSIVAVVFLAEDLLPHVPTPSATAIGLSVAAMNLAGCWFAAMPVCHGSGGLAAQFRFGARSGASVIFLGTLKIVIGLFASDLVLEWCCRFPGSVLAILLVLAGAELVKMGENVNSKGARDLWEASTEEETHGEGRRTREVKRFVEPDVQVRTRRYLLMMITVAATLGTHNVGVGFLAGLGLWLVYRVQDWDARRREGRIRLEDGEASDE